MFAVAFESMSSVQAQLRCLMKQHHARLCSAAGLVIVLNAATTSTIAGQQPPSPDPPVQGQRLEARDGDTVILEGDARVNIVRRRQAHVRAVFNQAQASLLLLVSHVVADAGTAGQGVDESFTFQALSGAWPLGARWEGDAVLEQYSDSVSRGLPSGIGFSSPLGMVQLFGRAEDQQLFADPGAAAVLFYRGSGAGGGGRQTFDDAERMQIAMATRDAETNARLPAGARSMTLNRCRLRWRLATPARTRSFQPAASVEWQAGSDRHDDAGLVSMNGHDYTPRISYGIVGIADRRGGRFA